MSFKSLFKKLFKNEKEDNQKYTEHKEVLQFTRVDSYRPVVIAPKGFSVKLINNEFVETN